MNEAEWVASVIPLITIPLAARYPSLQVKQGLRLPYTHEAVRYSAAGEPESRSQAYQTDLALVELGQLGSWKPRVVIECKFERITTHDAITYSDKAAAHKNVHPYLRYGFIIGFRRDYPLPGRLFRHGGDFDFMISWASEQPTEIELDALIQVLSKEVEASRLLEEMILGSRNPFREKYYVLHRPLVLAKAGEKLRSA